MPRIKKSDESQEMPVFHKKAYRIYFIGSLLFANLCFGDPPPGIILTPGGTPGLGDPIGGLTSPLGSREILSGGGNGGVAGVRIPIRLSNGRIVVVDAVEKPLIRPWSHGRYISNDLAMWESVLEYNQIAANRGLTGPLYGFRNAFHIHGGGPFGTPNHAQILMYNYRVGTGQNVLRVGGQPLFGGPAVFGGNSNAFGDGAVQMRQRLIEIFGERGMERFTSRYNRALRLMQQWHFDTKPDNLLWEIIRVQRNQRFDFIHSVHGPVRFQPRAVDLAPWGNTNQSSMTSWIEQLRNFGRRRR